MHLRRRVRQEQGLPVGLFALRTVCAPDLLYPTAASCSGAGGTNNRGVGFEAKRSPTCLSMTTSPPVLLPER